MLSLPINDTINHMNLVKRCNDTVIPIAPKPNRLRASSDLAQEGGNNKIFKYVKYLHIKHFSRNLNIFQI